MNAYELADDVESWDTGANYSVSIKAAQMLRQQAERIAELEKEKIMAYENGYEDGRKPDTNPQIKELSDEEILVLAETYKNGWVENNFERQLFMDAEALVLFARAILKKASEK